MHDTRVPRPLEVPPTRAHGARTGRAALAAPKKKMQEGGAHFWGLDTAISRGGGGAPLHTCFGGGGRKSIMLRTCTSCGCLGGVGLGFVSKLLTYFWALVAVSPVVGGL